MAPRLEGTYEASPPTLLDLAARDRRWCQGNLQHARLLGAAGLHWVSRLHLLRGIFGYVAPALWLAQVVCGAVVFRPERWRDAATGGEMALLFAVMVVLLLGPKLMAYAAAMGDGRLRAEFGGGRRLTAGLALEGLTSILTAPLLMIMQTAAVVEVLIGRDSGWTAQRRDSLGVSLRQAWRAHRGHMAIGAAGAAGALMLDPYLLVWTSPLFLALMLSTLLSLHTSRASPTAADRGRRRLLQTPEDVHPPPVLARAQALRRAYDEGAELRRQIDDLFRAPAAVHRLGAPTRSSDRSRLAA
jgi:membrane glycosyltransferase